MGNLRIERSLRQMDLLRGLIFYPLGMDRINFGFPLSRPLAEAFSQPLSGPSTWLRGSFPWCGGPSRNPFESRPTPDSDPNPTRPLANPSRSSSNPLGPSPSSWPFVDFRPLPWRTPFFPLRGNLSSALRGHLHPALGGILSSPPPTPWWPFVVLRGPSWTPFPFRPS